MLSPQRYRDSQVRKTNAEPAVLVHYVALIGNQAIIRITHCRWRCGSLVTKCPLPFLLSMTYQLLLYMVYQFQSSLGKKDCTDLWVIKLTNKVSPSSGFWVSHFTSSL